MKFEKNVNYFVGIGECKISVKTTSTGRYQLNEFSITGRSYDEVMPVIKKGVWEINELIGEYNKIEEQKKIKSKPKTDVKGLN